MGGITYLSFFKIKNHITMLLFEIVDTQNFAKAY